MVVPFGTTIGLGHLRRGTNAKPEVDAWIAAQRLNRLAQAAIASATAAWAILLDRSAVRGKRPNSRRGRGRPRHNVGRATSPVRLPKTAWKLAKLQGGAASDAPPAHC